jgi:hypothetical protein
MSNWRLVADCRRTIITRRKIMECRLDMRYAAGSALEDVNLGEVVKSPRYSSEPHDLSASRAFDLGTIGNVISGLVGGGVLGQIVTLALPSLVAAAQSGNLSVGGVISQLVAGGAGGAILTAIIGAIKNKAAA